MFDNDELLLSTYYSNMIIILILYSLRRCLNHPHIGVMAHMLQIGYIHRIFLAWVVFKEAIFSCLNFKPYDGFLLLSILVD